MNYSIPTLALASLLCANSTLAEDQGKAPQNLSTPNLIIKEAPAVPAQNQDAQTPSKMTHFDPKKIIPQQGPAPQGNTPPLPQVAPGKITPPSGGNRHSAQPATPPQGPPAPGFQTPDHLIKDGLHTPDGLPGSEGMYQSAVRELFDAAEGVEEIDGLEVEAVDPGGQLGGSQGAGLDDLEDALGRNRGGLESAGFMPAATTPQKQPANAGNNSKGAPTGPANSMAEAIGGAAALDDGDPGSVTKTEIEVFEDGTTRSTETRGHLESGGELTIIREARPDGSRSEYVESRFEDGSGLATATEYDADGNPTSEETMQFDSRPPISIRRTQDPNDSGDSSGFWARWMAKWSGKRVDLSMKDPNQSMPEDGENTAPTTPRINLGDRPLVNPDPNATSGQAREVSDAQKAKWRSDLLEGEDRLNKPEGKDQ